ncbi:hypothetical protein ACFLQL_00580 [Verrucomicrobiota bacterium]
MEREQVYKIIDSERSYQDQKWNSETTTSDGIHSIEEWLMYIEDYVNEAKHILSREARQTANTKGMEIIRKVGAMAVCAIEQHGAPRRF